MISMHKLAIISIPTETSGIKKIISLLLESETSLPFPENTWNLYFILKPRSALNLCSLHGFIAFFEIFGWIILFSWGRWFVIKRTTCWVIRPPFLSLFGNHSCHQWSIFFIMNIGMKLDWVETSKLFSTYSTFKLDMCLFLFAVSSEMLFQYRVRSQMREVTQAAPKCAPEFCFW